MIGYILALFPIYIFLYQPLSQFLFGAAPPKGRTDLHFDESFVAPPEDPNLLCPEHGYKTYVLSREPLVLYLEGWLAAEEAQELLETSASEFQNSSTSTGPDTKTDPSVRLSQVATLPRTTLVQCLESRARALQGWSFTRPSPSPLFPYSSSPPPPPSENDDDPAPADDNPTTIMLERLKMQKYGPGGHYTYHYDWQGAGRVDRASSFMVYVHAKCTGGGTAFPRLRLPRAAQWCRFLECRDGHGDGQGGVVFTPIQGNAVYWENLRPDGTGYTETWHAGLPVKTGMKVGLNIWSWHQF